MGTQEYRGVWRRSESCHYFRRIGRIVERELSDGHPACARLVPARYRRKRRRIRCHEDPQGSRGYRKKVRRLAWCGFPRRLASEAGRGAAESVLRFEFSAERGWLAVA